MHCGEITLSYVKCHRTAQPMPLVYAGRSIAYRFVHNESALYRLLPAVICTHDVRVVLISMHACREERGERDIVFTISKLTVFQKKGLLVVKRMQKYVVSSLYLTALA